MRQKYPREQFFILTKVGRVKSDMFDYSPDWVRYSVNRSCKRLHTNYLDVVFCHDVEFVSPPEVLAAVQELRRLRDQGLVRYVGISGYPVKILCELAEMILEKTGQPLDIIQSYSNFTIQNTRLLTDGLDRFVAAGVDVVLNASPLSMGLIRSTGVPIGSMGDWHPAPDELRTAVLTASKWVDDQKDKIEKVAFRFAVENWMKKGSAVGTSAWTPSKRLGITIMGVSSLAELDESMSVWRSVLDAAEDSPPQDTPKSTDHVGRAPSPVVPDHKWNVRRRDEVQKLAEGIRGILGDWVDYAWTSRGEGFVNQPHDEITDPEVKMAKAMVAETVAGKLTVPAGTMTTPRNDPEKP